MTKPAKAETPEPVAFDTPAKAMPGHRVINPDDPARWHRWEVEDDSPLGKAYRRGQLFAGRREYTAEDRYGAGTLYRGIYDAVHGSGVACSNLNRVSGAANEARSSERICIARDLRKRIEDRMSKDNFYVVERFCGSGSFASDAVRERFEGFEKSVYQCICLALDDLIDAVMKLGLHKRAA